MLHFLIKVGDVFNLRLNFNKQAQKVTKRTAKKNSNLNDYNESHNVMKDTCQHAT